MDQSGYELRLELEDFNEKINSFWDYYSYLPSANSTTKRYFNDMFREFESGNYDYAKILIGKLVQRLDEEKNNIYHQNVEYMFNAAIENLKYADEICNKVLKLIVVDELDEKTQLQKQRKEINIRLTELSDEKFPYLNLSLSVMFILMSVIFVFLPNFFYNSILMYHLCGVMFLFGLILLKQEIEFRNKNGFVSNSLNATNKRSIIYLVQAFVYIIPLTILSIFFFDSIYLRIALYIQIWFCGVLFLCGLCIMINNALRNKKLEKKNFWNLFLELIGLVGFILQLLQIFKVI